MGIMSRYGTSVREYSMRFERTRKKRRIIRICLLKEERHETTDLFPCLFDMAVIDNAFSWSVLDMFCYLKLVGGLLCACALWILSHKFLYTCSTLTRKIPNNYHYLEKKPELALSISFIYYVEVNYDNMVIILAECLPVVALPGSWPHFSGSFYQNGGHVFL